MSRVTWLIPLATLVSFTALAMSCGGDEIAEPPRFDGASAAGSFVIHWKQKTTIKGMGTGTVTETLEFEAADRFRLEQTGAEWLPRSAVAIGDNVWDLSGTQKADKILILVPYTSLVGLEETLKAGAHDSSSRGPRIQGEQTKRYTLQGKDIFRGLAESLAESTPPISNADSAVRTFRQVDSTIAIYVGIETGRIYRIIMKQQGLYAVSRILLEVTEFGRAPRITVPPQAPTQPR